MPFQSLSLVSNPTVAYLLAAEGERCTLVNLDATNTVVIGDNNAVQVDDEMSVPFGPGQILAVDGSTDVYGTLQPGVALTVLKFPGATHIAGNTGQTPSQTPPKIATAIATSGATVDLIGGTGQPNPKGLPIQLLVCAVSTTVSAAAPSAMSGTDQIQDSTAVAYLPLQWSISSNGGNLFPTLAVPMYGAVVPAGRKLQIANSGGAGLVHQCAAMVAYYLVADPL